MARGGALGLVGAVFAAVAGFALVIVVTRGLAPSLAGTFFSATALFAMVVALTSLGTEAGLARFMIRLETEGRASQIRPLLRGILTVVLTGALGVAIIAVLVGGPLTWQLHWGAEGQRLVLLCAVALPVAVLSDFALAATRAFGMMRPTVLVDRILRTGSQAGVAWVVLLGGGGLLWALGSWLAAYAVAAALAGVALIRLLRVRIGAGHVRPSSPVRQKGVTREFWSFTWPRGLTRFAQIAIQKADIVLVAALLTPSHAAVYVVATRFVPLGQFATQALQQVLQPRFTAILVKSDRATLREVYRVATAWNIALTWPVYLAVGAAPLAYLAIFGGRYANNHDAVLTVIVMTVAMLAAVAVGPIDTLLLMAGRSRISLINATTALALDIGLCLVLIPRIGILGAALAWAVAVIARCSLAVFWVRRDLHVVPAGRQSAIAAAAALVTVALPLGLASVLGLRSPAIWLGLVVVVGAAYLALLWVFRRVLRLDLLVTAVWPSIGVRAAVGRVHKALPPWAVRVVRRCALWWGMATAGWRMTPSFVIVGAQRSGTTTLFRLLADHPQVVRPTLSKGTGFFDDGYRHGSRWYRAHFPLRRRGKPGAVTFECSGYYMFHPHAPARLARDLPDVRVVAVLRDPVERAYSAHEHERARGFESLPFDEACELEPARTADEAARLASDEHHVSFEHRHHSYLARGEYDGQLRRLHEAFGPERVHVVEADEFFANPVEEFARLQEWLGLQIWRPQHVDAWNARPRAAMEGSLRTRLEAHFAPHDRALAQLLGHVPVWRVRQLTEPREASIR